MPLEEIYNRKHFFFFFLQEKSPSFALHSVIQIILILHVSFTNNAQNNYCKVQSKIKILIKHVSVCMFKYVVNAKLLTRNTYDLFRLSKDFSAMNAIVS